MNVTTAAADFPRVFVRARFEMRTGRSLVATVYEEGARVFRAVLWVVDHQGRGLYRYSWEKTTTRDADAAAGAASALLQRAVAFFSGGSLE